jgi:hypothetical protein
MTTVTGSINGSVSELALYSDLDEVPFTVADRRKLNEIHEAMVAFAALLERVEPMLGQLGSSPIGRMLGL